MILVTGAAGKTGRAILQALAHRNAPTRAYVYREGQVAATHAAGASEVYIGDLQDLAALRQAMQGVRAIYHICPNMHPDEVAIGQTMLAAAQAAQVERVVYHSVLHPQTEQMPHHWNKLRVEELIFASRLPFTILQPTAYMQNLLAGWETIRDQGRYIIPYPAETQIALVDLGDVAAVAATVLTEPGHHGATYELVGVAGLTQHDVAAAMSIAVGRTVQIVERTHADWEQGARASGLGEYAIHTLRQMFTYYAQQGLVGNANVLGWLLGRAPVSLATFLQRASHSSA